MTPAPIPTGGATADLDPADPGPAHPAPAHPAAAATLRRMRWWDLEEVLPIERELFGEEEWSPALFWSELAQIDSRHYLVAGEPVVGYAGLCAYRYEGYVQTIAVRRSAQGRGIGRALLEALLTEAARRGLEQVGLEVRADNEPAQRLYAAYGFVAVGRRRGYYQPSNTDAIVMVRRCPSAPVDTAPGS